MKYDFDKIIPRRGTNSYKWDSSLVGKDVLPLWVADMDFRTAPAITDALAKRVAHGIFGYSYVPDEYYTAVIRWFERRHNWSIRKEWIIYTSGCSCYFSHHQGIDRTRGWRGRADSCV